MKAYGFNRLDHHEAEHKAFCIKVEELWQAFKSSPLTTATDTMFFLRDWIAHHVSQEDNHLRTVHLLAALMA